MDEFDFQQTDNREYVLECVKKDGKLLDFASDRLKDDKGRRLLIDITETGYKYDPYFWEKKTIQKILNNNFKVTFIPDWRYYNTYQFFNVFVFRSKP